MLLPIFTVADVIPLQYVATFYVGWCYCQMADRIATCYLLYVVMAGVIAQWQMEWPLQGVNAPS